MDQYGDLATALINGHLYLDLPVPDELAAMENPYDFYARLEFCDADTPVYWDYAFYDGHYYCYFGVVPVVLVYVPYQLITGSMLSSSIAAALFGVTTICAGTWLTANVANTYFPRASVGITVLCVLTFFAGCNVLYGASLPRFYSVAILSAMTFAFAGLSLCIHAKHRSRELGRVPAASLALGCACLALTFGCRPQFALSLLLVFVIFWDEIKTRRLLFSRRGIKPTAFALVATALVLFVLMWYNYARFGSPLNVGSHYNLTGFDMQNYAQEWSCTAFVLYQYLIQPPDLTSSFPYVNSRPFTDAYGWAPHEAMYGGIFWLCPFLLFIFAAPAIFKQLREKRILFWFSTMLVFAALVVLVDARNAGVSERYISDFGWYLSLCACFVILALAEKHERSKAVRAIMPTVLIIMLAISAAIGGFSLLSPDRYDAVASLNPSLYETLDSLLP